MSQYSELQVALINARDGYEKRRANFTDPKDKQIHKRQCDLISAHIMDLPELTAARDESERLRGRVAELEKEDITTCLSELMRGLEIPAGAGAMPPHGFYALGRAIADQAKSASQSATLRKQADSVEYCETKLNRIPGAMLWDMDQMQSWLNSEAQRLRQQADEAEKAGG